MSGRRALVVAAATALAAAGGWFGASVLAGDDEAGTAVTVGEGAQLVACPTADGAEVIGTVAAGDTVWLVGVTDDRWGVVRHPDDPRRPAWVPLARLSTTVRAGDLPEVRCTAATTEVATTTTAAPTTTVTGAAATTTTVPATSTTGVSTTSTTVPSDRVPPTVTLTSDRPYLYTSPAPGACAAEAELLVSVAVADPTLPVSVRAISATWNSPTGQHTANLSPVGGRFRLVIDANGPAGGELQVTITASGADGAGNIGTGALVVALRDPASFGCA